MISLSLNLDVLVLLSALKMDWSTTESEGWTKSLVDMRVDGVYEKCPLDALRGSEHEHAAFDNFFDNCYCYSYLYREMHKNRFRHIHFDDIHQLELDACH